ncbi:hypothetical protein [Parvibaculum sp. MBR-TMA-1.3b-4.2]|jgi:hypothetical protein
MVKIPQFLKEEIEATYNEYVNALGRVAHSWNNLQEQLAFLFACVTGMDNSVAYAIWYSTNNDRAQREMLRAAVNAKSEYWEHPEYVGEGLTWLINKANSLADQRNDAIHAPCSMAAGYDGLEIAPFYFYGNPRAMKLKDKDVVRHFKWYEAYADTLSEYAKEVSIFMDGRPGSWPEKPTMPSLGQKNSDTE